MKILFTFMGGNGHFVPLVPIANAAQAAGHTVAFGCGPSMVNTVKAAGFTVYQLGTGSGSPPERSPLQPLDMAREDAEFQDRFARDGAQYRAPLTRALCQEWQPDLWVGDETDFGGMAAAESLGLPYATILVMAAGSFVRKDLIREALQELRAQLGLKPDPDLEMLSRYLVLSPFPPSFRDPAYALPPTGHAYCPPFTKTDPPAWLQKLSNRPLIYFTLGTVFNMESGDLFNRVLAGLRELPINVVVTVGPYIDPAEFGPQPDHIHIERYIAQDVILPHCDLLVSHGGSGSVAGSLLHGKPSVLIPMGADQPLNALRCVELGLGQMLDPLAADPVSVREAVNTVLETPSYRQTALRLREEFTALPGPDAMVRLLEQLKA